MQDILNPKIFELERLNNRIVSCKKALYEVEDKINYLDMLCIDGKMQSLQEEKEDKNILALKKENLTKKLKTLESDKEKLNDELINSEAISELIKIKYALLLSNYAVYHDNPASKPKKEVRTLIQKIMNFNKT